MKVCFMLKKCFEASGLDCKNRDYTICLFIQNLLKEKKRHE